uniref:Uncharacterized protein n=1 Tax=Oryza sativa subsp. japonica TaxID=39947 RepID=Q6K995_ORYSJ|nr:hypothetical protein [Oryza sativa Japonica Group]BAD19255.1 hypothetical protein [Oryza sativa Japonica Group]
MKALRSLVVAVLHGLDDPEVIKTVRTAVPTVMGGFAEEDEADPADEEFFQEQAGYDEF